MQISNALMLFFSPSESNFPWSRVRGHLGVQVCDLLPGETALLERDCQGRRGQTERGGVGPNANGDARRSASV